MDCEPGSHPAKQKASRIAGQQDSRTAGQQVSRTTGKQDSRPAGQYLLHIICVVTTYIYYLSCVAKIIHRY